MIVVTKKRDIVDNTVYYMGKCNKCNAEFVFESGDILSYDRRTGTKWIDCPECSNKIHWTDSFLYVSKPVHIITKEKFTAISSNSTMEEKGE